MANNGRFSAILSSGAIAEKKNIAVPLKTRHNKILAIKLGKDWAENRDLLFLNHLKGNTITEDSTNLTHEMFDFWLQASSAKCFGGGAVGYSVRPASGRLGDRIPAVTDPSRLNR